MCAVLQSSLGGAGSAEKEAGKIRAGMQRAQAECREAGEQGRALNTAVGPPSCLCRAPKHLCHSPALPNCSTQDQHHCWVHAGWDPACLSSEGLHPESSPDALGMGCSRGCPPGKPHVPSSKGRCHPVPPPAQCKRLECGDVSATLSADKRLQLEWEITH